MLRYFLSVLFVGLLCSCSVIHDMEKELEKTDGLNERALFDMFGKPDNKIFTGDKVVLIYVRKDGDAKHNKRRYITYDGHDLEETEPYILETDHSMCILKFTLDRDRVIHHAFSGDSKGCRPWLEILEQRFGTDTFAFPD